MIENEQQYLQAEKKEIEELLELLPNSQVIEKISLANRKKEIELKLESFAVKKGVLMNTLNQSINNIIDILEKDKNIEFDSNKISDGYHTFEELYEHRIVLFISLCKVLSPLFPIWKSLKHSDDTQFDKWFILGINKHPGKQITYHIPKKYWSITGFAEALEKAPPFDGHTSEDVLKRLTDEFIK